jgi:dihydropteroate synthase
VFSFEDKESFDLICSQNIPICICHQGNRDNKGNIFEQIKIFFEEKKAEFEAGGYCTEKIIYDPGFGYGKSNFQNLDLLSNLNKISENRILLAGLSQKKFLRLLFESSENHLNDQSLSAGIIATLGGANILRVHQVKETVNLLKNLWSK